MTVLNRTEPPLDKSIGAAPDWFSADQREVWEQITESAPTGMLLRSDRIAVELTVMLVIRCRTGSALRGDFTQCESMLRACGLTPRSRQRIMKVIEKSHQRSLRPN